MQLNHLSSFWGPPQTSAEFWAAKKSLAAPCTVKARLPSDLSLVAGLFCAADGGDHYASQDSQGRHNRQQFYERKSTLRVESAIPQILLLQKQIPLQSLSRAGGEDAAGACHEWMS